MSPVCNRIGAGRIGIKHEFGSSRCPACNPKITDLMDRALLITDDHDDNIAAEVPIAVWREIAHQVTRLELALLEAKSANLHYEHVLEHVCDKHPVPNAPPHTACPECQRMARQALDGEHREEFRDLQRYFDDPE